MALTDKDASCAELRHEYEVLLDEANKKAQEALAKAKKDAMDAVHQKDDDIRQVTADCRAKIADKDKQLADLRKSSEEQLKRKDAQLLENTNNLNAKLAAEEERHAKAEAALRQKQDDIVKDLKAQLDGAIAKAKAELARKDSELEERRKRNEAMEAAKDKEIAQWKSRVAAKDKEIAQWK